MGYSYASNTMFSANSPKVGTTHRFDTFETVMDCLKRMESVLIGMKQMRGYVGKGVGREMLESLIEEAELQIEEVKRRVIQ